MRAVLFDIDGTLLLTGGAGKTSFIETFCEDFQVAEPWRDVPFSGRSDRAIAEDLMRAHGIATSQENWQRFLNGYCGRVRKSLQRLQGRLLPGVVELLDELSQMSDVAVGLLTGNVEHGAWAKLSHYGIADRFAFGGFGEHHTDRCDIAAAALAAAQQHVATLSNGTPCRLECVMVVGDTVFDIRCAKSINAVAVGVATGSTPAEELSAAGADLVLPDLRDPRPLVALLRSPSPS